MLNSGLGFSDEFEMEACQYSEKSSSKLKQQYKEWTSSMRKEGTAFFKSVKEKVRVFGLKPDNTQKIDLQYKICFALFVLIEVFCRQILQ